MAKKKDDVVNVVLNRKTAEELVNAHVIALGSNPAGKGKKNGGGKKKDGGGKPYTPAKKAAKPKKKGY